MTSDGQLLNRDAILAYLRELADVLPADRQHRIVMVGGSFLALHGLREATRDVDSLERLGPELVEAAATLAARHGLPARWLNDSAAMFWPQGLAASMCTPVINHPRLLVLEPPARYVFAMKLYSTRAVDSADLRPLWPLTEFSTAHEAIAFMRDCYPIAGEDPFLADYLRDHVIGSAAE